MRSLLLALLLVIPLAARADDAAEVGRYAVIKSGDTTVRLDTATGAAWYLCTTKKSKTGWCKAKDVPALPGGANGRYRLVDGAPLLLLDSVTGRSWQRCDLPTPEKGLAWCALED